MTPRMVHETPHRRCRRRSGRERPAACGAGAVAVGRRGRRGPVRSPRPAGRSASGLLRGRRRGRRGPGSPPAAGAVVSAATHLAAQRPALRQAAGLQRTPRPTGPSRVPRRRPRRPMFSCAERSRGRSSGFCRPRARPSRRCGPIRGVPARNGASRGLPAVLQARGEAVWRSTEPNIGGAEPLSTEYRRSRAPSDAHRRCGATSAERVRERPRSQQRPCAGRAAAPHTTRSAVTCSAHIRPGTRAEPDMRPLRV